MWIQEIQGNYKQCSSGCTVQNFLWRHDRQPLYVMDNHLAAAWCWMEECDKTDVYNFMHIDQHADLLNNLSIKDYGFFVDSNLTFEEYHGLTKTLRGRKIDPPIFRWDNYIIPMMRLFPNWFDKSFYAVLDDIDLHTRRSIGFLPYLHQNQLTLAGQVETAFTSAWNELDEMCGKEVHKWIVNLDMDYFFKDNEQMLTDSYILDLSDRIHRFIDNIQVLTVAFSPECCGGWNAAEHVFDVFCDGFPEFAEFLIARNYSLS